MAKRIAIMQPYLFPYLGYFQLIHCVDEFIMYDEVGFIKNGWINRNRLLSTNGHIFYLTIPLNKKTASSHHNISEVKIAPEQIWRKPLLKSIENNYKQSLYFDEVFPTVEEIFRFETDSISKFNFFSLESFCKLLSIASPTLLEEALVEEIELDLAKLNIPREEVKYRRIQSIAKFQNSTTYINPIGGLAIYDKAKMKELGLDLSFIKMKPISYPQKGSPFISGLSILDVLFHVGPTGTKELLEAYDLV